MEVYRYFKGFIFKDLARLFFRSIPYSYSISHDRELVKKKIDSVRINLYTRMTQGSKNPPPVGILTKEGGLYQRGMGDGIRSPFGIFPGSCSFNTNLNKLGCSLSIPDYTLRQILTDF